MHPYFFLLKNLRSKNAKNLLTYLLLKNLRSKNAKNLLTYLSLSFYILCFTIRPLAVAKEKASLPVKCQSAFSNRLKGLPDSNPFRDVADFSKSGVPFDKIKPKHIIPALRAAIKEAKSNIEQIKQKPASFKNTIEGLDLHDEKFNIINDIATVLESADPKVSDLLEQIQPESLELFELVNTDKTLFKKVKKVYDNPKIRNRLSAEKKELLEIFFSNLFHTNSLNKRDFQTLIDIEQKSESIARQFLLNILKEEKKYKKYISKISELKGIPQNLKDIMKENAIESGHPDKWLITLNSNLHLDVLGFAKNRTLRKNLYQDVNRLNYKTKYDNSKNLLKLIKLRNQEAKLFHYKNFAKYVLSDTMAKSPETVNDFLNKLKNTYFKAASKELQQLKKLAKEDGILNFQPWDFDFYLEKYKRKYPTRDGSPYFELNQVINGLFIIANKMFGLKFNETKYPKFHEDVKVYEVSTEKGVLLGSLYLDLFDRNNKNLSSFEQTFLRQKNSEDKQKKTHVIISMSLQNNKINLLSNYKLLSLFHEFGHALHDLLNKTSYNSLFMQNTSKDFVEFPSQLMEKWTFHKQSLRLFAKHYKTGKMIPDSLIEELNNNKEILWMEELDTLKHSILDLALHSNPKIINNPKKLAKKVTNDLSLFQNTECPNVLLCNSESFADGYESEYYSYLWSQILVNNAFKVFEKKGLFHKKTNQDYRRLLEQSGYKNPNDLYKKFTGISPLQSVQQNTNK